MSSLTFPFRMFIYLFDFFLNILSGAFDATASAQRSDSALFSIGTKVAHSCAPNCCYTTKVLNDRLINFAVKPISDGENITFSYCGYKSTLQR